MNGTSNKKGYLMPLGIAHVTISTHSFKTLGSDAEE